jgi:hypothetical protein
VVQKKANDLVTGSVGTGRERKGSGTTRADESRIHALFHERPHRLELPVTRRQEEDRQRDRERLEAFLGIHSDIEQMAKAGHIGPGSHEHRTGEVGGRTDDETSLAQEAADLGAAGLERRGQHLSTRVRRDNVGAGGQQHPHRRELAVPRRRDERRPAVAGLRIHVRAALEQKLDVLRSRHGPHENGGAESVGGVRTRAAVEQVANHLRTGQQRRVHQRRGATRIGRVDVGIAPNQHPHRGGIVAVKYRP